MKTIKEVTSHEFEIKKSKFISFAIPLSSGDDVKPIVKQFKEYYKDARHVVYAYVCGSEVGFDDDNEPSKTAGFSMLEVLKYKQMDHVLVVCIRYFGGIKLGSGGLIRAYAQSCSEVLNNCKIGEQIQASKIVFDVDLNVADKIDHLLKNYTIANLDYSWGVKCQISFDIIDEQLEQLINHLKQIDFTITLQVDQNKSIILIDKE